MSPLSFVLCCLLLLFSLPALALESRTLTHAAAEYTVVELDLQRDALRLYWRDRRGEPLGTLAALAEHERAAGRELLFATNAGIYAEGQVPLGLTVEDGREQVALNTARGGGNFFLQPNGVFAVDRHGQARIVATRDWARRAQPLRLATQSGPLLLIGGRINPRLLPDSDSLKLRSGVCVQAPTRVAFAISAGPVNFYRFASMLRDELGCRDALYLDGSISQLQVDGKTYGAPGWRTRPFAALLGVSRPAP